MDRKTLSTIATGLAGLVFVLCLLPWFSVSKEEIEKRGTDFSEETQSWFETRMIEAADGEAVLEFIKKEYGDGVSYSGLSTGGLATWLLAILGGALCALVLLGKAALVKTTERGVLWIALLCFGIATLAAFIGILSTPTPKTFFAWLAFLACAGAGGLCFVATTKPPTAAGSAAPAPAPTPDQTPEAASEASANADEDAGSEAGSDED